ncbi:U2 small nuclear ribonucleoprotein B'' [Wickerhamiella sorbophila]|uniref:U2 small nuclear ribonucleoprotein B n=1 Tax=Wickerhamiella sorbophila TaxID=45607 RepID=A0A2T0FI90_9ASCO|nr:U2 small nuclear ribonucleoprotein B'' [Wickerhamiella sorbophila]PRT54686.1 U2 small nuclear ribonucleoprotein B'' [Wickerhamiella sorbophila]
MDTLYIRNLNEKLGVQKLRAELIAIFARFGTVSGIQARKTLRLKGQAFISFELAAHAEAAREALNGQTFLGKPLDVQFAKNSLRVTIEGEKAAHPSSQGHTNEKHRSKRRSESLHTSQSKRLKATEKPNKILFVENLAESISQEVFSSAFNELPGFVEARLVAARAVGFVEFLTVEDAIAAIKKPLIFGEKSAHVSFAKH